MLTRIHSEVGGQILIVFVGGSAFQVTSMNGRDWGISIALGFMSIPIGFLICCVPNAPCKRFLIRSKILPDPSKLPTVQSQVVSKQWDDVIELVKDSLATFSNLCLSVVICGQEQTVKVGLCWNTAVCHYWP